LSDVETAEENESSAVYFAFKELPMSNDASLYDQLETRIVNEGYCCIMRSITGKVEYYRSNGSILEPIDIFFLRAMFKKMLQLYLNRNNLKTAKANGNESIVIGDITVHLEELEAASKKGFSLTREIKEFIEVLNTSLDFIKPENAFLPKPLQLPLQNGTINFIGSERFFTPINEDDVFFSRCNACYINLEGRTEFPPLFMNVICNGISNPNLPDDINKERQESFLDCLAYSLISGNPLIKFFWIYGATQAGKSKLLECMKVIFADYAVEIQASTLTLHGRQNPELRPDLHKLSGKMLIICSETENTKKLDTRLIKTITGGDFVPVRTLYSDQLTNTKISGNIYVISNFPPNFTNPDDEAIHERTVVIDWHNTVPHDMRNQNLVEQLTTEEMRTWIMSALIERAAGLLRNGTVSLNIHPTFFYTPPPKQSNIRTSQQQAFDDFCEDGIIPWDPSTSFGPNGFKHIPPLHGRDIYNAYLNFCYSKKYSEASCLEFKAFTMKFGGYVSKVQAELALFAKKHYPNGNFYSGFFLHPSYIVYPLKLPTDNNGKPIGISPEGLLPTYG